VTKADIITKTLADMAHKHEGDPDYVAAVVLPALNERVPEGDSKTCGDFKHLDVECCDTCHTFYAQYEMEAIDLPEGGKAWVCHAVRCALFPETRVDENFAEAKVFEKLFGGGTSEE
jgi:hypothetical protein